MKQKSVVMQKDISQPAKSLKSNTGGGSFCLISIEDAVPYTQKYTPPHCLLSDFAGWASRYY